MGKFCSKGVEEGIPSDVVEETLRLTESHRDSSVEAECLKLLSQLKALRGKVRAGTRKFEAEFHAIHGDRLTTSEDIPPELTAIKEEYRTLRARYIELRSASHPKVYAPFGVWERGTPEPPRARVCSSVGEGTRAQALNTAHQLVTAEDSADEDLGLMI